MASNQYVNKVIVNDQTVIDLTNDTVTPNALRMGYTAHDKSGELIVGTGLFTNTSDGSEAGPIFNLTAEGHAEQDGTPTPDNPVEIQVARGRNLLPITTFPTYSGLTFTRTDDNGIKFTGTPSANGTVTLWSDASNPLVITSEGILSIGVRKSGDYEFRMRTTSDTIVSISNNQSSVAIPVGTYKACEMYVTSSKTYNVTLYPQLTLGSTPQLYVPYGHVGLECSMQLIDTFTDKIMGQESYAPVRSDHDTLAYLYKVAPNITYTIMRSGGNRTRVAAYDTIPAIGTYGELLHDVAIEEKLVEVKPTKQYMLVYLSANTTNYPVQYAKVVVSTPIPLPSRGWVGSLPDGTADRLILDGAGRVVWNEKTEETTQAVTDGVSATVGVDAMSSTGQIADGATVLYKLITSVVEYCGYVNLPDIPVGASISIPELDNLNVEYFIDDSILKLAQAWYLRSRYEMALDIQYAVDEIDEIDT